MTVFLDSVFKPFFPPKSSMTRANNWRKIGRISWRMDSFKSFNVGACERKHVISKTPKEKKNLENCIQEDGRHLTY